LGIPSQFTNQSRGYGHTSRAPHVMLIAGRNVLTAGLNVLIAGRDMLIAGRYMLIAGRYMLIAGRYMLCLLQAGICQYLNGQNQRQTASLSIYLSVPPLPPLFLPPSLPPLSLFLSLSLFFCSMYVYIYIIKYNMVKTAGTVSPSPTRASTGRRPSRFDRFCRLL
jgi:hypothetical protein